MLFSVITMWSSACSITKNMKTGIAFNCAIQSEKDSSFKHIRISSNSWLFKAKAPRSPDSDGALKSVMLGLFMFSYRLSVDHLRYLDLTIKQKTFIRHRFSQSISATSKYLFLSACLMTFTKLA